MGLDRMEFSLPKGHNVKDATIEGGVLSGVTFAGNASNETVGGSDLINEHFATFLTYPKAIMGV